MSFAGSLLLNRRSRIGPGRLVLIVGPSGVGKDTLIAGAREALREDPQFVFPRRVITRPATASEDHDSVAVEEFQRALANNAFACAWEAHGLLYGIPIANDDQLRAGRTVICNVSRTIIKAMYARYERTIVVQITAPAHVISARLTARGRGSDGDLESRMKRGLSASTFFRPDFTIENAGAPEIGIRKLVGILSAPNSPSNFAAEMLF